MFETNDRDDVGAAFDRAWATEPGDPERPRPPRQRRHVQLLRGQPGRVPGRGRPRRPRDHRRLGRQPPLRPHQRLGPPAAPPAHDRRRRRPTPSSTPTSPSSAAARSAARWPSCSPSSAARVVVLERWPQPYPLPRPCTSTTRSAASSRPAASAPRSATISEPGRRLRVAQRRGHDAAALRPRRRRRRRAGPSRRCSTSPRSRRCSTERAGELPGDRRCAAASRSPALEQADDARRRSRHDADGRRSRCGPLRRRLRRRQQHRARPRSASPVHDLGFFYDWLIVDVVLRRAARVRPDQPADLRPGPADHRRVGRPGPAPLGVHAPARTRRSTSSTTSGGAWELLAPWDVHPGNATPRAPRRLHVPGPLRRAVARRAGPARRRRRPPDAAVRRPGHVLGHPRRRQPGLEARPRPRRPRRRRAARHLRSRSGCPSARAGDRVLDGARQGHLRARPRRGGRPRRGHGRRASAGEPTEIPPLPPIDGGLVHAADALRRAPLRPGHVDSTVAGLFDDVPRRRMAARHHRRRRRSRSTPTWRAWFAVDRRRGRRPRPTPATSTAPTPAGSPSTTRRWALQRPDFHLYGTASERGRRRRRCSPTSASTSAPTPTTDPDRRSPTVKIANVNGRAVLVLGDEIADIATASDGRFGPDPMALYDDWAAFVEFAGDASRAGTGPLVEADLALPRARARARCSPSASTTAATPRSPAWPSPTCRPRSPSSRPVARRSVRRRRARRRQRRLGGRARRRHRPPGRPGRRGRRLGPHRRAHRRPGHQRPAPAVRRRRASSRSASRAAATARWAPGSSPPTSSTTPTTSPSAARSTARRCRTPAPATSIFSVPRLVAELSAVLPLLPGDIIFTGTPAGVGVTRQPPRFLQPGQVLEIVDRGHRHHPQRVPVTRRASPRGSARRPERRSDRPDVLVVSTFWPWRHRSAPSRR